MDLQTNFLYNLHPKIGQKIPLLEAEMAWLGAHLACCRVGLKPSWSWADLAWGPRWLGSSWFGANLARKHCPIA